MDKTNNSTIIGDFITKNLKTIIACLCFVVGMYIQHQQNIAKIERLEQQLAVTNGKLEAQYVKLDNVKLDKAVFEATMKQFTEMSTDIREIRDRMEDILGNYHGKQKYAETGR